MCTESELGRSQKKQKEAEVKKLILIAMSALFVVTLHSEAKETEEAKIYSKAKFIRFRKGVNIYGGNGERPCFESVPKEFSGRKIMLREFQSSFPIEFEVKKAGIVTLVVAANLRAKETLLQQGWNEVDTATYVGGKIVEIPILQKYLTEGEYSIPSPRQGNFGYRLLKK